MHSRALPQRRGVADAGHFTGPRERHRVMLPRCMPDLQGCATGRERSLINWLCSAMRGEQFGPTREGCVLAARGSPAAWPCSQTARERSRMVRPFSQGTPPRVQKNMQNLYWTRCAGSSYFSCKSTTFSVTSGGLDGSSDQSRAVCG